MTAADDGCARAEPAPAPRIAPLEGWEDGEVAGLLSRMPARDGQPLNVFRVLARHPELLRRWAALGTVFLEGGVVPPRAREIVVLRTGWRCRSEYEFGQHTLIGRRVGLTGAEIVALTRPVEEHAWSDGDRALVLLVDEICATDAVADGTWEALRRRFDEPALLELVSLVGYYRLVSALLNAVRVPLEPGTPGWPAG